MSLCFFSYAPNAVAEPSPYGLAREIASAKQNNLPNSVVHVVCPGMEDNTGWVNDWVNDISRRFDKIEILPR